MGALGDSFYEYLLKEWLRSGKTDNTAKEMFDQAATDVENELVKTSASGLIYFAEQKYVLITGDQLSTDTTFSENSQDMEIMNKDGTTKLCSAKSKYPLKVVDAAVGAGTQHVVSTFSPDASP